MSVKCEYCKDTGEIETDNNGPIGGCPMCSKNHHSKHSIERSFPQDIGGENGGYINKCFACEWVFTGHKRRTLCALCDDSLTAAYPCVDMPEKPMKVEPKRAIASDPNRNTR